MAYDKTANLERFSVENAEAGCIILARRAVNMTFHATYTRSGADSKEAIVKRMTVVFAVCTMFLVTTIQAHAPQGPPKPGPEVKKLEYNIGMWNAIRPDAFMLSR